MNLNEYENEFVLLITYDDNYISDKPLGLSGQNSQFIDCLWYDLSCLWYDS